MHCDDRRTERTLSRQDLALLRVSPAGYLAAVGVDYGAPWSSAFEHAQELIVAFGTSRSISADEAVDLAAAMVDWAARLGDGR